MNSESLNQGRYQIELLSTDAMVPKDHLLRVIDEHIDFSFITEKTNPYYREGIGRPSLPPIRLFKMLLIGYLYGIRSERQLEMEVHFNIAYRWFLGLGLNDPIPDHSTISYNRNKRFKDSDVFQKIFDELVRIAIGHHMVAGRVLLTDATHIRANASNDRYTVQVVEETPHAYLQELEEAVQKDREEHGLKPLPPEKNKTVEVTRKTSVTDPECGFMKRINKPEGFHYLEHRTVDAKFNIITDAYITAGNVNEPVVYIERLQRQIDTFDFQSLEAVALDSSYLTPYVCMKTMKMELFAVIADRKKPQKPDILPKAKFTYDPAQEVYICPQGQTLRYTTTGRNGKRVYAANPATCANCPLLDQCTKTENGQRKIERHVWESHRESVLENTKSNDGISLLHMRQRKIEPSFGEAKELHQYRRSKYRGRAKMQEQALLTAFAQNVKKIARHLAKKALRDHEGGFSLLFIRFITVTAF